MKDARENLSNNEFVPGETYRYISGDGRYAQDPLILELFVAENHWTVTVKRASGAKDTGFMQEIRSLTPGGVILRANKILGKRGVVLPVDASSWQVVRRRVETPAHDEANSRSTFRDIANTVRSDLSGWQSPQ